MRFINKQPQDTIKQTLFFQGDDMPEIIQLKTHTIQEPLIAAMGFFDGIHLAHQALIQKTINIGKEKNLKTAIITFDVHPKTVIYGLEYRYITPFPQKLDMLTSFPVDYIYVIQFNKHIAQSDPQVFIDDYLTSINTLVCGFDFKFGYRGSGNTALLKKQTRFDTVILEQMTYENAKIGSTHIRDLIEAGYVHQIPSTLGRFYSIKGPVIHGAKKGRLIGYPTANIDVDHFMVPKTGVYISKTWYANQWYDSMTSVGYNPTLNRQKQVSVESYLFDFDKTIYGEVIESYFVKRLRDEMKFDDVSSLIKQIDHDGEQTKNYLKKHRFPLPFDKTVL